MVQKGQFLERATLVPLGKQVLEATYHRGQRLPPLLAVPPRPDEGGGMDHVLNAELVWAAAGAGHATLRFNHRGVGASQGTRGTGEALVEDALAALELACDNAGAHAAVVSALHGGASTALALLGRAPERVAGLFLVSPRDVAPATLARLRVPLRVLVGEEVPPREREALARAAQTAGGELELLEDEGPTFHRALPQVGRHLAVFLRQVAPG